MKPIKIMSPPVSSSASQATAEQGLEEMLDKVKKLEVPSAEVATGLGSQWALWTPPQRLINMMVTSLGA